MTTNLIIDIPPATAGACWVELETGAAAGTFQPITDCPVERIVRAADGAPEYALLRLRPQPGQDQLGCWSRARRIALVARAGATEQYLFCGPPAIAEWKLGEKTDPAEQLLLKVEGLSTALQRCADLTVIGRFARTRADWSTDSSGNWAAKVDAVPCIFSPDARCNCAASPITVKLRDGRTQQIHVFTHEDDPDAQDWTIARALRYLAWFHLRQHPWLDVESLLDATQAGSAAAAEDRDYLRDSQPVEWSLRACLTAFSAEGSNAIDAFAKLVAQAGLHWCIDPIGSAGLVRCQLRIWSDRQGEPRCFTVADARQGALPGGGDAFQGEVVSCTLRRDLGAGAKRAIVIGDVKYYEVTVTLVPGWVPETSVDAVPYSQRSATKAQALLDDDIKALGEDVALNPWYQKYHRKGSAFAAHQDVGRKWVLNEHGRYVALLYNRYPPFDSYQPFRFATVLSRQVADADRWIVRPRRFLQPITQTSSNQRVPIAVDLSFDGGASWSAYTGPLRMLSSECGLVIDENNPCSITPPGVDASKSNLWYSLIDQQARLRVTALIQGDQRITAAAGTSDASWWDASLLIPAQRQLPYASAAGATNVLRAARLEGADVDSTPVAQHRATAALDDKPSLTFDATLPGLRLDVALGQRIWGLARTGTQMFESDMTTPLPTIRTIEYVTSHGRQTKVSAE